jgi:chromosome segregation ATPase
MSKKQRNYDDAVERRMYGEPAKPAEGAPEPTQATLDAIAELENQPHERITYLRQQFAAERTKGERLEIDLIDARENLHDLRAQLAAERERADAVIGAVMDAQYARVKAERDLHMARLEIDARKQECQTVTRKRDEAEQQASEWIQATKDADARAEKAEAEAKALKEALRQIAENRATLSNPRNYAYELEEARRIARAALGEEIEG